MSTSGLLVQSSLYSQWREMVPIDEKICFSIRSITFSRSFFLPAGAWVWAPSSCRCLTKYKRTQASCLCLAVAHPQMCNPYILFIIYRRLYKKHKKRRKKEIAIEEERKRQGKYGKKPESRENYNIGSRMWMQKEIRINGQPQVGNTTQASNCWCTGLLERCRKLWIF